MVLFVLLLAISTVPLASQTWAINALKSTGPQSYSADGILDIIYGDSFDHHISDTQYYLAMSDGTRLRLWFSTPPSFTYFGKHVTVTGTKISASGNGENSMLVSSVSLYDPSGSGLAGTGAALGSQTGTRRVAVILLKFSDVFSEPETPSFYSGIFNPSTGNTVNAFYLADSYGQLSMQATVFGWWNLPSSKATYANCGWPSVCADLDLLFNDGTAVAIANGVNFANFDFISLVFNNDLDCCAWGGGRTATLNGVYKFWPTTWIPTWSGEVGTYVHELGHALGLPHSGWVYYAYDSPWDAMSEGRNAPVNCGSYYSINDGATRTIWCYTSVDTIASYKDVLGWINPNVVTVNAGSSATVTLDSLAATTLGSNPVMVKVCVSGRSCTSPNENTIRTTSAFYFTVEARTRIGSFDQYLPGEGIIIHAFDDSRPPQGSGNPCFFNTQSGPAYPIDSTPGDWVGPPTCAPPSGKTVPDYALYNAQWTPGQTYTSSTYGISIRVDSRSGSTLVITVNPGGGPGLLSVALISPPSPSNGTAVTSSPVTLAAQVTGSGPIQDATVTIYVDSVQVCSGTSNSSGYLSCLYILTQSGRAYSWYATASKVGYVPGTSPTWTFTFNPPTYSVTFQESGIPSGVTWGVTVGGTRYTSSSSSVPVSGLSGSVGYSYDSSVPGSGGTYVCSSGCSGSVSGATTVTATYTFQPTVNLSQISTTILNAPARSVYFVRTGNMFDDSALGFVYAKCSNPPQIMMIQTDASKVNQTSGAPLFSGNVVLFGGMAASKIVKYYEGKGVARVTFSANATHYRFMNKTGVAYAVPISSWNYSKADYFVVQIYMDGSRVVFSMWGLEETGTYASGVYFSDLVYPNLASMTQSYYICSWTDYNNDGIQQSNEITVLATGT